MSGVFDVLKNLGVPVSARSSLDRAMKHLVVYVELDMFDRLVIHVEGKKRIRCEIFCVRVPGEIRCIHRDCFYIGNEVMVAVESFCREMVKFMAREPAYLDALLLFVSCNFNGISGNHSSHVRHLGGDEAGGLGVGKEMFLSMLLEKLMPSVTCPGVMSFMSNFLHIEPKRME